MAALHHILTTSATGRLPTLATSPEADIPTQANELPFRTSAVGGKRSSPPLARGMLQHPMTKMLFLLIAVVGSGLASPAKACRIYTPSANLSVLHRQLPPSLPSEIFVAEVQFERPDAGWRELREGARAHVVRLIQGDYTGDVVIIRDTADLRVTCYAPVRYEGHGIILGSPVGTEGGFLVVEPIFETPDERH